MRSILQEDNKIVDLITFIGDPFPKTSFLMDSSGDTVQTDHLINTSSRDNSEEVETKSLNESGTGESSPCLNDLTVDGCEPLIGALIKPHEGVSSNDPFDIHPKQIVSWYSSIFSPNNKLQEACSLTTFNIPTLQNH